MGLKMKAALVPLMVVLLLPGVSHALTHKQKVLLGLQGVGVLVEPVKSDAERLGLTTDKIKTDVELRLRKAGIKVLTEKEYFETQGNPYLYVNINTGIDSGLCIFSIKVELSEMVTLSNGSKASATIWNTSLLGSIGTSNIRKLRDHVGDLVDNFINDYLAANPKK